MADKIHEVLDGLQFQRVAESVLYSVDTTAWGGTPTSPVHDVFDEEDLTTSLKSSLMSGSPTVAGDNINLPALSGLTLGIIYTVTVLFVSAGSTLEGYFQVKAV